MLESSFNSWAGLAQDQRKKVKDHEVNNLVIQKTNESKIGSEIANTSAV